PEWQRAEAPVSAVPGGTIPPRRPLLLGGLAAPPDPPGPGSPSGPARVGVTSTVAPTANRRSGSSVLTPITTSPRTPCGRPIRPTTIRIESADLVGVQQVDPDVAAVRQGADHGTQRPGGAPAPPDDLAEVFGMNPHLEDAAPAQRPASHLNVIRILDDAPD